MTKLVVGPFNRVEGDLEVTLDVVDGTVASARVTAPLYRGFEQILRGRLALDALVIAPRICGVCSVSQSAAAAGALGGAMEVTPPPNGQAAANLILACENAVDHLTNFYLYFMPDFASAAYAERPWHDEAARRYNAETGQALKEALAARTAFLRVMGVLAGKWPHHLALQPGGVTKSVDLGERMRLLSVLAEFRWFLETRTFGCPLEQVARLSRPEDLAEWAERPPAAAADLGVFLHIAEDLRLADYGHGPARFLSYGGFPDPDGALFTGGVWRDGQRGPVQFADLREDLSHSWLSGGSLHPAEGVTLPDADRAEGYSWAKAPRLGGESYEVGAYARLLVTGHPLIRALAAGRDGAANVRDRVVARLVELALLVPAMERWTKSLGAAGSFCEVGDLPKLATGVGLVESARGSLGHWLAVDDGRISHYQIVGPSTWNLSPRDAAGQPGPLEQALVGAPVHPGETYPMMVQHIVRSYDPCMGCTVH